MAYKRLKRCEIPSDFRIDIGRAADPSRPGKGCTFIRVVHETTGKERFVVGLRQANEPGILYRFIDELRKEIDAEKTRAGEKLGRSAD
jgi:hypothetical protein